MEELLAVDHLDEADARSLASRLAELGVGTAVCEADGFCVNVDGDGAVLAAVLHAIEEWAGLAGAASVCVRLDGRSYALEGRSRPYAADTSR